MFTVKGTGFWAYGLRFTVSVPGFE